MFFPQKISGYRLHFTYVIADMSPYQMAQSNTLGPPALHSPLIQELFPPDKVYLTMYLHVVCMLEYYHNAGRDFVQFSIQ